MPQGYIDAWHRYLRGASGVSELRMAESHSSHPGVWSQYHDIPYPNIPTHPTLTLPVTENTNPQSTEYLISSMATLESEIGHLRETTGRYFGSGVNNTVIQDTEE